MRDYRSVIILGLVLTLFTFSGCKPGDKKPADDQDKRQEVVPINVRVEAPGTRDMFEVIEVNGNLDPIQAADVYSKASGLIEQVFVEEGDLVKKDRILAKVEDDEIEMSYRQARSAFRVASQKYERYKGLAEAKMISEQEYQDMERSYRDAKINLEMYQLRLANTEVRAPLAGTVVDRLIESNQLVGNMEVIFTIAKLDEYKILTYVTEAEMGNIHVGQQVRIRVDALNSGTDDYPYNGRIHLISPMVNPQNGTVDVEVRLPDPNGELAMGMFSRMKIITESHLAAKVILKKALAGEEVDQVWLAFGNRAKIKDIKTGISDDRYIEILEGLGDEDLVITEGHSTLTEKSRINIVSHATDSSD